jgi:hypothetical protein
MQVQITCPRTRSADFDMDQAFDFTMTFAVDAENCRPDGRHYARLAADAGASDDEIARSVGVGGATVYQTKRRLVLGCFWGDNDEPSRNSQ